MTYVDGQPTNPFLMLMTETTAVLIRSKATVDLQPGRAD